MKTSAYINVLVLIAAYWAYCGRSAYADETKMAPWVIEMARSEAALRMTLDLLPLCAHSDWDSQVLAKASQALAQYKYEALKASNDLDLDNPNYKAIEHAAKRRDELLQTILTKSQLSQLSNLKVLSDIIQKQGEDAAQAYAQDCAVKLVEIAKNAKEIAAWEITIQDLSNFLVSLKDNPKLDKPNTQAAISALQDALKNSPEKAMMLVKQLTSTLKKTDV